MWIQICMMNCLIRICTVSIQLFPYFDALTHCIWWTFPLLYVGRVHLSFRGVGSNLLLLFYFCWKILLGNTVDSDQMPHNGASDQGLHCLSMTFYMFPGKNGIKMLIFEQADLTV